MAKEVTPELLSQLEQYLKDRSRGELTLLLFYYKEVFGRELNINCGGCIDDGARHLKRFVESKNKQVMGNWKWVGGDNATIPLNSKGINTIVAKENFSDTYGEIISTIHKYAHNVEYVGPVVESGPVVNPAVKKKEEQFIQVSPGITSTSEIVKTDTQKVKTKKGKQGLK